jgi:predicted DNA-binding ribbon-helix-helix protein
MENPLMKSLVIKRSIVIDGHKTSISLEDAFWRGLKEIAQDQHMTLSKLVGDIDANRRDGNLSSAIRLFVLDRVRAQITDSVHSARTNVSNASPPQPHAGLVQAGHL